MGGRSHSFIPRVGRNTLTMVVPDVKPLPRLRLLRRLCGVFGPTELHAPSPQPSQRVLQSQSSLEGVRFA